ncbi:FecCD family ABC transporter permease [Mailhella massiliensis]|uniref:FecCD family ABC transporter permease n=1 Tax=Mailhella massiliensis TaxID=1903261 RepID=UPI00097D6025|nr:iron ABC transporter permease [Mailhella massiliensis]
MKTLRVPLVVLLCCALAAAFFHALLAGEYSLGIGDVLQSLSVHAGWSDGTAQKTHEIILWRIRLPRLLLACITGMAMAVSGAVYQGCFRNPLVEPYILGVSAGASCGAALAIVFPMFFPGGQLSAFLMGMAAVLLSFFLARNRGETPPVTLVLSGIIVGSLFSACIGIMKYLASDVELREITFWMMGGFYYATWEDVAICACTVLPCLALLFALAWKLNILSLGDEEARSLGVHPERLRVLFIILATLAASVCVSAAGIIAWVGLMMPHAARMLFGPDNRWVIPASALLGALYLLLCDTIARTLTGAEIPIAIITSIVGAPYLLWLLRAKGRELYGA